MGAFSGGSPELTAEFALAAAQREPRPVLAMNPVTSRALDYQLFSAERAWTGADMLHCMLQGNETCFCNAFKLHNELDTCRTSLVSPEQPVGT